MTDEPFKLPIVAGVDLSWEIKSNLVNNRPRPDPDVQLLEHATGLVEADLASRKPPVKFSFDSFATIASCPRKLLLLLFKHNVQFKTSSLTSSYSLPPANDVEYLKTRLLTYKAG